MDDRLSRSMEMARLTFWLFLNAVTVHGSLADVFRAEYFPTA